MIYLTINVLYKLNNASAWGVRPMAYLTINVLYKLTDKNGERRQYNNILNN